MQNSFGLKSWKFFKLKIFYLRILLVFVGISWMSITSINAQEIIRFDELSENLVTQEQRDFLDKMFASEFYTEGKIVSTESVAIELKQNLMWLELPGFTKTIKAEKVNSNSMASPYYDEIWMGTINETGIGNVMFIRKDQLIAGFIQSQYGFYSIVPTAGNVSFLLKHDIDKYDKLRCSDQGLKNIVEKTLTSTLCMSPPSKCSAVIDVSVLVTDPAREFLSELPGASSNPFIPILYALIGLESTNFAAINSNISNVYFRFTIRRFFGSSPLIVGFVFLADERHRTICSSLSAKITLVYQEN
jgi:hypothetical protein